MSKKLLALSVTALTLSMPMFAFSQQGQMKGMDMPMKHSEKLMGMFKSEKGTLTGIKQGQHILELRVVAEDHVTELDASDKVWFVVK